jgi:hypothetical protein
LEFPTGRRSGKEHLCGAHLGLTATYPACKTRNHPALDAKTFHDES